MALWCVQLATLELHFPELPSLYGFWLLSPQEMFYPRFGKFKWSDGHIEFWRSVLGIGTVATHACWCMSAGLPGWYRAVPSPLAPPTLIRSPPSASPSAKTTECAAPADHLGHQGWDGERQTRFPGHPNGFLLSFFSSTFSVSSQLSVWLIYSELTIAN